MTTNLYADTGATSEFLGLFYSREISYYGAPPRTLAEYRMCRFSAILRNKPHWWEKFKDEAIAVKWRKEAIDQGLDEKQVDYVLAELEDYAKMRDDKSGAEVSCFDNIWQSDTLISGENRAALRTAVGKLEDVPDSDKDWHPNSNDLVLDLVHPSLYPLVYRRTIGASALEPIEAPLKNKRDWSHSDDFAWLPTDFTIAPDGSSAKAQAYINNIHPSNKSLVSAIENIVASFVPLFNRVLTDQLLGNDQDFLLRIPDHYDYDESDYPSREPGETNSDYRERYIEWNETKRLILPETPNFKPGSRLRRTKTYTINGRNVQAIVKLANIHLNPEQPEYGGGSWHIEGMTNERIVASGIYYYDEENISESRLAFRQAVSDPERYRQDDSRGVSAVWGLANQSEMVQDLGSVETKEGRCICFPNIYQHCVSPFSLVDHEKPGHRKILALFLVDPSKRIPSTTEVAPQQQGWIIQALNAAARDQNSYLSRIPHELIDLIISKLSSTMTHDEALAYRLELMEERTHYVLDSNAGGGFFGRKFNMCEH